MDIRLAALLLAGLLAGACDSHPPAGDDHGHGHEEEHGHDHGHGHDDDDDDDHENGDEHAHTPAAGRGSTSDEHDHGHDHDHEHGHDESEPDFAALEPASSGQHGIVIDRAGAGTIEETVSLTGRLVIDPAQVALVRARFPGPVVAVTRQAGDPVRQDDVLARVESNESLTVYEIRSPLSGIVLERFTNVGDVAGGDPLFRIGDPGRLQAELTAFPGQQAGLERGASVRLQLGGTEIGGTVLAVLPELESHTQGLRVRVALDADGARSVRPGQVVTGRVTLNRTGLPVVIPAGAVQRLEGREVVFVPETDGFRARPVTMGRRGATDVEIRTGLEAGERYVSAGAFLLKAEIGKNLAEHSH